MTPGDKLECTGPYGYVGKSYAVEMPLTFKDVAPRANADLCIKHPTSATLLGMVCVNSQRIFEKVPVL